MHPETKTRLQLSAYQLYFVGGVALVLAALTWLSPTPPPQPLLMGKLESDFRAELTALVGLDAQQRCTYWAKHLYIVCGSAHTHPALPESSLFGRGWRREGSSEKPKLYIRKQWRMKVLCAPLESSSCALEIWFVGGRNQASLSPALSKTSAAFASNP
jgi:hypothetical protein